MEEKRKIDVEIAGMKMSLITDESESFVESVVRRVNDSMASLLQSGKNRTRLDAAMLCALTVRSPSRALRVLRYSP